MGAPLRFVGGEKLVAKSGRGNVEDNSDVIGAQVFILQKAAHHGGEKIGHFGGNAGGGLQAIHGGVKGAKNIAHGVDEEEPLFVFIGHVIGAIRLAITKIANYWREIQV